MEHARHAAAVKFIEIGNGRGLGRVERQLVSSDVEVVHNRFCDSDWEGRLLYPSELPDHIQEDAMVVLASGRAGRR